MNTFYANMAIDAIQNAKHNWLDTFVKDESFKSPMAAFVDAQTVFTKQIAKSAADVADATGTAVFNMMKGGK